MSKYTRETKVKVTKIDDLKFGGKHPNGVDIGNIYEGYLMFEPAVKEPLLLVNPSTFPNLGALNFHHNVVLRTSLIVKIENDLIYTRNSIYKIETTEPEVKLFCIPVEWKSKGELFIEASSENDATDMIKKTFESFKIPNSDSTTLKIISDDKNT
jgi:hypothetical protein